MQTETKQRLGEIAAIERELAQVIDGALKRVRDEDTRNRMKGAARRHRQHAEEILGIQGITELDSPEVAEERSGMKQRVQHAVGEDGLMAALGHLEQEEEVRLGEVLAADVDPQLADRLRAQQSDIAEDVRVFLDKAASRAPATGGPRTRL